MEFGATPDQIVAALKSAGLEVVLVTPELRELLDEVSAYSKSSGGLLWLEFEVICWTLLRSGPRALRAWLGARGRNDQGRT
jgi:hypothetical protein